MKNIKLGDMKVRDFFRFTLKKIVVDLVISLVLVLLIFFSVPLLKNTFLMAGLIRQIIDVIFNTLIFMFIFYSLSCFIALKLFKMEKRK